MDDNQKTVNKPGLWARAWDFVRHYIGGLIGRAGEDHLVLMAGGLAFSIFICAIPMVLVIFSVIGMIVQKSSVTNSISAYIDRIIPYHSEALRLKVLTFNRIREFGAHKHATGLIGLVGLMFASTGLFSSMRTILNRIFRVRRSAPFFKDKLHDLIMIMLVLCFFLISVAIWPLFDVGTKYAEQFSFLHKLDLKIVQAVLLEIVSFIIIIIAYGVMYYSVPGRRPPFKCVLVGSFWAGVLWEAARQLFGLYLLYGANFQKIYGAYTFLVIVAVWVYYSSIIFIAGAVIGRLYADRHAPEIASE